jgi:hypothetical protein
MSNTKTEAQRLAEFKDLEFWPAGVGLTDWVESVCAEVLRLDAVLADEFNNRDVLDKMLTQCITERDQLRAQLDQAVAEEREACAFECESRQANGNRTHTHPDECAAAIRARSNP